MHKNIRLYALCLLSFLPSVAGAAIRVEQVIVTGAYMIPETWVLRRAGLKAEYSDESALEKALHACEQRLLGTGRFLFIESFFLTTEDRSSAEVYLTLTEGLMPGTGSELFNPTLFGNIPFHGWATGFYVSEKEQSAVLFPVTGPPVDGGFAIGHRFLEDASSVMARAFIRVDLWPSWAVEAAALGLIPVGDSVDAISIGGVGSVGIDADYSYLLNIGRFAFRNVIAAHAGFGDTWSFSFEEDVRLYAKIATFLHMATRGRFYIGGAMGAYGYSFQDFIGDAFRAIGPSVDTDLAIVASGDIRFPRIFAIDIGFTDLEFGAFCFIDGAFYREIVSLRGFPAPAIGGGIKFTLGMPINLTVIFGYGWGFKSDTGRFLFTIGQWY